ncbi:MAG: glycerol kinase, partial [Parasporobacterium sp.]|nr:glycerol kinase [Parasporobacterium sp.]
LTAGFWKDKEDLMAHYETGRTFEPSMSEAEREKLIRGWKKAINTACAWAVDDGAELI